MVDQVDECGSGGPIVLRADDAVDEAHGEVDAVPVAQDRGQSAGGAVLDVAAGGDAQPAPSGVDRVIRDLLQLCDPLGHGGVRVRCVRVRCRHDALLRRVVLDCCR